MWRKVRKFRAMSWPEQRVLLGATLLFPVLELGLRTRGMQWSQAQLARTIPTRPLQDHLTPEMLNMVVIRAAGAGPYYATCLRRSLMLWWLLQRRGVPCQIKIGATTAAGGFHAHAWVEWEGGKSDSDQVTNRFTVFKPMGRPEAE